MKNAKEGVSLIKFILIGLTTLLFLTSFDTRGERLVSGVITDRNGAPANVRVKAMDDDWPDADDHMQTTFTDTAGQYQMSYAGGHWDPAPHWYTIWRPDIFIRVSAAVNGACEGGRFNENKRFVFLQDSRVTNDHPHRNNLTKNLRLTGFPLPAFVNQTFTLGQNMFCQVDFFLHTSCFACTAAGEKLSWDEWSFTGVPRTRSRCAEQPLPQCTQGDFDRIRNLNIELSQMPLPTDRAALTYMEPPEGQILSVIIVLIVVVVFFVWRVIIRKAKKRAANFSGT